MSNAEDHEDRSARLQRIREIVNDDYDRVSQATTPHEVLNAASSETMSQIEARYERYERFYRAENFQRLGDMDLTRKALEIRRSIGRAISDVRQNLRTTAGNPAVTHDTNLFELDEDRVAMGDIYLRDGMTYLHLGDYAEASEMLQRSVHYNPTRGISLAYLGYVLFKHRSYDPGVIEEAREYLDRASDVEPDDPDIFVLRGRFFAKLRELTPLKECILSIERINPAHPMLDKLQRKFNELSR